MTLGKLECLWVTKEEMDEVEGRVPEGKLRKT